MSSSAESPSRAPADWCQIVLEKALDAVIGIDSNDRIFDWNHQAEITFGHLKRDVIGKLMGQVIFPVEDYQLHAKGLRHFLQTGESATLNRRIEKTALHRSGRRFPVELSIIPVENDGNSLFYSFLRDISEQKRMIAQEEAARKLLALQYKVMSLLSDDAAFDQVLKEIGTALNWDLAFLWTHDESTNGIVCTKTWLSPEAPELADFLDQSCTLSLQKGMSLPGKVWQTGIPYWTNEAPAETHFMRRELAGQHGLHSGLWVPLRSGVHTWGVLELMRHDAAPLKEDVLQGMKVLGQHIGQAIERVNMNKELSLAVQKYQNLLSRSAEGVWRFELDHPVSTELSEDEQIERFFKDAYLAECNHAMAAMYGSDSTQSLIGLRAHQLLIRDDPKNVEYLRAFIRAGYSLNDAESVELDQFGQTRVFLNNLVGIMEDNQLVRAWGIQRDVTEQKKTSDQLKQSEQKYRHIFGLSPQPLWILDCATLQILDVNQAATEKYGYSRDEFLQMTALDLLPPEERAASARCIELKDREPINHYYTHLCKDGTAMLVEITPSTLILDGRRVRILLINDVTDQVRNEKDKEQLRRDLERAKEAAEKASRLKSAFLANMSHEIRTPLGALLGFTDLLMDPEASANEKLIYQETIRRNGELLTTLIDDILDLSKVEAGHMTTETLNFSIDALFADIKATLILKAQQKGLEFHTEIVSGFPDEVGSDPTRLRQILINLTGNAIKFTEKGSVVLKASYERDSSTLEFEVSDTGIGISAEQAERLFQPFMQADASMTRRYGGTGLGLVLSKRLAQLLGGDVELKESSARGSTFRVLVKDQRSGDLKVSPLTPSHREIQRFEGLKVLVVDDSSDNQLLIERLLTRMGAHAELASNGFEAIEKASQGHHDLVLMDIQMPQLDGYSATERLREQGYQKPIFALTAHAMSEVKQKSLTAGCNAHLTKPISRDELYKAISEHCLP